MSISLPIARLAVVLLAVCLAGGAAAEQGVRLVTEGTPHRALYAVAFADGKGLAVGEYGSVMASTDGGKSWALTAELLEDFALLDVALRGSRQIAVGQAGHIFVRDAGEDWRQVQSGSSERLTGVALNAEGAAVAVGTFGVVLLSTDGGERWQPAAVDWQHMVAGGYEPHLYDVHVAADGAITVVGEFGLILRSTDGGASWSSRTVGKESLFGMHMREDGVGFAVGQEGVVFRTEDGGDRWQPLPTGSSANLLSVWAEPDGRVVIAGMRAMLQSADHGRTWQELDDELATRRWYAAVAGSGGNPGIVAVGEGGRIAKVLQRSAP